MAADGGSQAVSSKLFFLVTWVSPSRSLPPRRVPWPFWSSRGTALPHPPCLCLPPGDRPKSQCREGTSDPPSPLLLPSPGTRKAVTEKLPGAHEEPEDNHPGGGPWAEGGQPERPGAEHSGTTPWGPLPRGWLPALPSTSQPALPSAPPPTGKPTGYKTPPVAKISPGASLPESRTLDTVRATGTQAHSCEVRRPRAEGSS